MRPILLLPVLLATLVAAPVMAQETVLQVENVRFAYAQVLRVSPVYQTLTATAIEQECDQSPAPETDESRLSRVVGAVRDALTRQSDDKPDPGCRAVPVEREFRRPIAYDVDYVYKDLKFRSRLPDDPGNRLRIRIGVTPVVVGSRSE